MAVTIKQIAKLTGVSRGTVDRALNHRGGVKKEVEERILKVAEELNYRPNTVAKALANTKKNAVIGVILNSDGNDFFDEVLRGIAKAQKEVENYGIRLAVRVMKGFDTSAQLALIDALAADGIQALALTPINDAAIAKKLNEVSETGVTVATFNGDIVGVKKLLFVGCNYMKSGEIAGSLMGQFHPQGATVGIVTGSVKMLGHNQRIRGFSNVLQADFPNLRIADIIENFDDDDLSYDQVKQLFDLHPEINALYFAAAGIRGGIRAVSELGLAGKIKIITFDETPFIIEMLKQDIIHATIGQQPFSQGYRVIQAISDFLVLQKRPKHVHQYTRNEIKLKYNIED